MHISSAGTHRAAALLLIALSTSLAAGCAADPEGEVAPETDVVPESTESTDSTAVPAAADEEESELRKSARKMGEASLVAPVMVSRQLPQYTEEAVDSGIEGDVYVEAVVTTEGTVAEPKLVRGLPDDELNRRAMEAIAEWTFEPGTVDGEPVPVIALFTVSFKVH